MRALTGLAGSQGRADSPLWGLTWKAGKVGKSGDGEGEVEREKVRGNKRRKERVYLCRGENSGEGDDIRGSHTEKGEAAREP